MSSLAITLVVLALLALPLAALARLLRVYPRPPLVYLALLPVVVSMGVLPARGTAWLPMVLGLLAALVGL